MRQTSGAAALLLFCCAAPARADEPSSTGHHATIAHDVLELEAAVAEVTPDMYQALDALLDDAQALKLPAGAATAAEAYDALTRIDRLLTRHGFAAPGWGQVETLRDALNPTQVDKSKADLLGHFNNDNRTAYIKDHKTAAFHFFDSHSGSLLYLAIGELTGLPLSLMETPGVGTFQGNHYFIRYRLEGGAPYYWNVVRGEEQRAADHSTALDRDGALGYVLWMRANAWLRLGSYRRAAADFDAAARLSPANPGIANGFAWLLATCPDPRYRDGERAVSYSRIATRLAPKNFVYEDTLAAALAANGQFAAAQAIQQRVVKELGGQGARADEYLHREKLYLVGEPYLAGRREEQVARDYCEQFHESAEETLQCPAP